MRINEREFLEWQNETYEFDVTLSSLSIPTGRVANAEKEAAEEKSSGTRALDYPLEI